MKKSTNVVLTTVLLSAIVSCQEQAPKDEWIIGNENGKTRDTVVNNRPYRHYGAMWFPIIAGRISPATYNGATASQISNPSYVPSRAVRSGGFGSSSRSVSS
jgi:hypothetical protein